MKYDKASSASASPADVAEAIEFVLPQGEPRMRFDLGDEINMVSASLAAREGRVGRHYDGGFALNFDDIKKWDGDDACRATHDKRSIKAAGPGQGPTPRALTRRPTLAF